LPGSEEFVHLRELINQWLLHFKSSGPVGPRRDRDLKEYFSHVLLTYSLAVLLSLLGVIWIMQLWNADLSLPINYSGDAVSMAMLAKCGIDNGWCLHNKFIGMPGGGEIQDYPVPDTLHLLWFKFFTLFTSNHFLAVNLYFLLTFPLTTTTSLLALRSLKISTFPAVIASLLCTFVPYHFMRGIPHLFLSAYYLIPLALMVCLWTYAKAPPFFENSTTRWRPSFRPWSKSVPKLLICVLVAAAGVYYAFFTSYLILISAIAGSLSSRRVRHLISGMLLVAVITVFLLINLSPSIFYHSKNGANPEIANRSASDTELYALKISQLVLPITGHRVRFLENLKNAYNQWSRPTENDTSSLGTIGSVGFILLIWQLLFRRSVRDPTKLLTRLSVLNGAALLLGTLGGLGTVFSLLVSAQIRAYNRLSIFIAFFSFFAIAIVLDTFWRRSSTSILRRSFLTAGFSALLVLAVVDQTSGHFVPRYQQVKSEFESDDKFVKEIEASVPPGAMIFQLPYVPYPENGAVQRMADYDLFRGYLHSSRLRWSYGAIRGRADDGWQRRVAAKPVPELLTTLSQAGFSGVYIDRNGFSGDKVTSLEKELSSLLTTPPLVSKNRRLVFFNLGSYGRSLPNQAGAPGLAAGKDAAVNPILVSWQGGFSIFEGTEAENWRWCSKQGELHLTNPSSTPRQIRLEMALQTGQPEDSKLEISSSMFTESLTISSDVFRFVKELTLPPGDHVVSFKSSAAQFEVPGDSRALFFRVLNFQLEEKP
jgi:hypothetical protein